MWADRRIGAPEKTPSAQQLGCESRLRSAARANRLGVRAPGLELRLRVCGRDGRI
jgi:hypothetical protein